MDIITATGAMIVFGSMTYSLYLHTRRHEKSAAVDYIFSRTDKSPKQKLLHTIDHSKHTLDVAIFLLTEKEIVTHMCQATKRGVKVRVLTDRTQATESPQQMANIQRLIDSGAQVMVNRHDGTMHLKVVISDQHTITAGSYNFTYSAEQKNNEVMLIIKDKQMAAAWTKQFNQMWHDQDDYASYPLDTNSKYA
ncbi:phospholipase D-like domain-containing protein [Thalassobacillus sp. CUG 92003]|uniref:phospholipase D-like domain-containing protein n=1 Tax=Thalassobacillus sp. CUG 92003 TaxID=2736641 RepID=UPI0015E73077|nr:phospholipase D-like domain-containing protein [Thalassobacillus sp. CUG 92003]